MQIEVKNITKKYCQNRPSLLFFGKINEAKCLIALNKISFKIKKSQIVGLIGKNGSGKTTLLKVISGLLDIDNGSIRVLGFNPFDKNYVFLRKLTFVMANKNQISEDISILDTFLLAKEIYELTLDEFNRNFKYLLEKFKCENLISKKINTLSTGQRLKFELILAFLHFPKIVLLDEPMDGLDFESKSDFKSFLSEYKKNNEAIIIFSTHDENDLYGLAERILLFDKGNLVRDEKFSDTKRHVRELKQIICFLENPVDIDFIKKSIKCELNYCYPNIVFYVKSEELHKKLNLITKLIPYRKITIENQSINKCLLSIVLK